jgi:hypothetical protein
MKRKFATIVLFLLALSVYGQTGSLDSALQNAVLQIQEGLKHGSTIVVYQFQSQNTQLSDYILNELFDKLVNLKQFTVLDRTAQEVIDAEIDFQFNKSSGMISDDTLASLTKRIGAGAIVTGSLDDAANEYRFRIRVIGTETTAAIISFVIGVNKNDRQIAAFSRQRITTGQKLAIGAENILFGLGSYLNGDVAGGLTITAGYLAAAGLMIIEATALDWDNPAVGVPATIGVVTGGLTIVYGFVRPFIFNHSPQMASVMDNTKPGIVLISDSFGNKVPAFQLSWSVKF